VEEEEEAMRRLQSVATGAASGGVRECACVCACVYVCTCPCVCACVRASVPERVNTGCLPYVAFVCVYACARVRARSCFGVYASQTVLFLVVLITRVYMCVYVSVSCLSVRLSVCGLCVCVDVFAWQKQGKGAGGDLGGGGKGGVWRASRQTG
jgi:hypothetical protein